MNKMQSCYSYVFDNLWYLIYSILVFIFGFSVGFQLIMGICCDFDGMYELFVFTKYTISLLVPAFVVDVILKKNENRKYKIIKLNLFDLIRFVKGQLFFIYPYLTGYDPNLYEWIKKHVNELKNYKISIYFNLGYIQGLTDKEFKEIHQIIYYLEEIIYHLEQSEHLKNNADQIQKKVKELNNLIVNFFKLNEKFINKEYAELQRKSMFSELG